MLPPPPSPPPGHVVTWVKVDHPVFDLVGVILSSLGLTGIVIGITVAMGSVVGLYLIRRGRRLAGRPPGGDLALHLAAD